MAGGENAVRTSVRDLTTGDTEDPGGSATGESLPAAELVALPSSAWPYGRVVLVAQAAPKNPSEQTKADLRKNRALLLGTLKELDVQVREAP